MGEVALLASQVRAAVLRGELQGPPSCRSLMRSGRWRVVVEGRTVRRSVVVEASRIEPALVALLRYAADDATRGVA